MEISLNHLRLFAHHGVMPDERTLGAWFDISITLEVEAQQAIESDELSDTVNYAEVANVIKEEMDVPSRLLEHVAGRIAKRVVREFPQVRTVSLEVSKEHPPIGLECHSSSVKITLKNAVS